jgi:hypothetical protein
LRVVPVGDLTILGLAIDSLIGNKNTKLQREGFKTESLDPNPPLFAINAKQN